MHKLDWSDLQYILAVSRNGSLAAAARELGVNHATVLRRIAKFEESHGTKLFDRLPQGYRLARDHAHLLGNIDLIADQVAGISRMITGETGGFQGTVHLTTTDTFCEVLMGRQISMFREAFPDVLPSLTVTNNRLDLARMDADITIRPAKALPDGFVGARVSDLAFGVYGAPEHGEREASEALHHMSWVGGADTLARSPAAEWITRHVPSTQIVARADSFVAMSDLAANGVGLAMIPCCLGETSGALAPVASLKERPATGVWVAAHQDRARSPRIQAFLDFLVESMVREAPLLAGQATGSEA